MLLKWARPHAMEVSNAPCFPPCPLILPQGLRHPRRVGCHPTSSRALVKGQPKGMERAGAFACMSTSETPEKDLRRLAPRMQRFDWPRPLSSAARGCTAAPAPTTSGRFAEMVIILTVSRSTVVAAVDRIRGGELVELAWILPRISRPSDRQSDLQHKPASPMMI